MKAVGGTHELLQDWSRRAGLNRGPADYEQARRACGKGSTVA